VGSRSRRWLGAIRYYAPALAVFLAGIVLWELVVGALNLQAFILPRPSAIVAALQENWGAGRFAILPSAQATLIEEVAAEQRSSVADPRLSPVPS